MTKKDDGSWSSWACRSRRGTNVAKVSMIVKGNRTPKYKVQHRNRCKLCGRPRGYIRHFALCRICFRKLALEGQIPGVTKSSW